LQLSLELAFPEERTADTDPLKGLCELAITAGRIGAHQGAEHLRLCLLENGLSRAGWRFVCRHGEAAYTPAAGLSEDPETQLDHILFYVEWQIRAALTEPLPVELGERLIPAVGHMLDPEIEIDPRLARAAFKHWQKLKTANQREAFARRNWVKVLNWYREEQPEFDSNQWRSGWKLIERKFHQWEMKKPKSANWHSLLGAFDHERFHVQPLTSAFELAQEGFRMRHCVATYTGQCLTGNYRLFSITEAESGKPLATASIRKSPRGWLADQVKGKLNRIPPRAVCRLGPVIEAAYIREEWRAANRAALQREMKNRQLRDDHEMKISQLRDKHTAYLDMRGKVEAAIQSSFTPDEVALLEERLPVLEALLEGELPPISIEQFHFIAVANGIGRANSELERLWLKYRRCSKTV
jgi:hypothetical protein